MGCCKTSPELGGKVGYLFCHPGIDVPAGAGRDASSACGLPRENQLGSSPSLLASPSAHPSPPPAACTSHPTASPRPTRPADARTHFPSGASAAPEGAPQSRHAAERAPPGGGNKRKSSTQPTIEPTDRRPTCTVTLPPTRVPRSLEGKAGPGPHCSQRGGAPLEPAARSLPRSPPPTVR